MPNRSLLRRALGRGTRTAADVGKKRLHEGSQHGTGLDDTLVLEPMHQSTRCTAVAQPTGNQKPARQPPSGARSELGACTPGTRVVPGSTPRRRDIST